MSELWLIFSFSNFWTQVVINFSGVFLKITFISAQFWAFYDLDCWNRMKNERNTVYFQIIKFWKNCNNKFIDPEEREKNEQVYLPWIEGKMNKFIDGREREKWTSWLTLKRQKNEQVDPEERKQSVTDVGQKAYRKQIYPWEMTIKQVGCFLFFLFLTLSINFQGFASGETLFSARFLTF